MKRELQILVLEDVPTDAELMERQLKNAGVDFVSRRVDDKASFLRELEQFPPDIILSDYSMPQFNGMEALELLQEQEKSVPFIVVTGSINEETAVKCIKSGAADYVLATRGSAIGDPGRLVAEPGSNRNLRGCLQQSATSSQLFFTCRPADDLFNRAGADYPVQILG